MHERIKQIRQAVGMTQAQFAEAIGLSRNYIAMVEIGQRVPSDRTIADICREFGVSPEWLRFGTGEMFPTRSREEELAATFGALSHDPDGSFRKAFIAGLAKLSPEAWQAISDWISDTFGVQTDKPPDDDAEK